jgi:hypothetical protein
MTVRLHRRSPEVRLQQTTLLSATAHGFATAPDLLGHLSESTRQAGKVIRHVRCSNLFLKKLDAMFWT